MQRLFKNQIKIISFSSIIIGIVFSFFAQINHVSAAATSTQTASCPSSVTKSFTTRDGFDFKFCYSADGSQINVEATQGNFKYLGYFKWTIEGEIPPNLPSYEGTGLNFKLTSGAYVFQYTSQESNKILSSLANGNQKIIPELLLGGPGYGPSVQYSPNSPTLYLKTSSSMAWSQSLIGINPTTANSDSKNIPISLTPPPKSSGVEFWYHGDGTKSDVKKSSNSVDFLKFISPLELLDTKTGKYYIAGNDSSFFSGFSNGQDFVDNGITVYWPEGGVNRINNTNSCNGFITVNTFYQQHYPSVNLIPVVYQGGTCQVHNSSGTQDYETLDKFSGNNVGKHFSGNSSGTGPYNGIIDGGTNNNVIPIKMTASNAVKMFFSEFSWSDKNQINNYGANSDKLTALNDNSGCASGNGCKKDILKSMNINDVNSYSVFTNVNKCTASPGLNPYLVVKLDSSANSKTDINSSATEGIIYVGFKKLADGSQMEATKCLFGLSSISPISFSNISGNTSNDGNWSGIQISNSAILANPQYSNSTSANDAGQSSGNSSSAVDTSQTPTCEISVSPLTWIICPVFNGAKDFSLWIFSILSDHLKVLPVTTVADPNGKYDSLYVVWQSFRDIGDVILVIAVIIIVYSEAVGGSIADAYNVRKMLPRILIAAILINLSIYAVNTLVDIFNILGVGISDLILRPFQSTDIFHFSPSGSQQLGAFGFGMLGAFVGGGGAVAAVFAAVQLGALGGIFGYVFLLALPLLVGALAIWITVMVRWGLIVLLTLFSPIAFALYALPNTETYFKKWWKLLVQALMVYPVVMVIVAIGSILSAITYKTGSISGGITGFVLQFLPLIATPFAFKISGGILGTISDYLTKNGMKWTSRLTKGARERKKEELGVKMNQSKKTLYDKLDNPASQTNSRFKRTGARFSRNRLGGRRMLEENSRINATQAKRIEEANATGSDTLSFADTVDKAAADAAVSTTKETIDGQTYVVSKNSKGEALKRINTTTGRVEYTDIRRGNNWHSSAVVDQASAMFRGNNAAHTANLRYVLNKSNTDEELTNAKNGMGTLIRSWGAKTPGDFTSILKGATIPLQETKLELKFLKFDDDGVPTLDTNGVVNELFEKRNSYNMGNLSASTVKNLSDNYSTMPPDQQEKIQKILKTFLQPGGPEVDNTGTPTGRMRPDGLSIPGPANTQEKWREFGKQFYIPPPGASNPFN